MAGLFWCWLLIGRAVIAILVLRAGGPRKEFLILDLYFFCFVLYVDL
jgi:hypothetical protein